MTPGSGLVEAREVVRSFGQTPALRGAGLTVAAGEILAVMGPSGSGKSTLLHCLAGILTPDSGAIWFDGRRVDQMSEAERSTLRRDQRVAAYADREVIVRDGTVTALAPGRAAS